MKSLCSCMLVALALASSPFALAKKDEIRVEIPEGQPLHILIDGDILRTKGTVLDESDREYYMEKALNDVLLFKQFPRLLEYNTSRRNRPDDAVVLDIQVSSWQVEPTGVISMTFWATLRAADGKETLGHFRGEAPMRIAISSTEVFTAVRSSAADAVLDLYPLLTERLEEGPPEERQSELDALVDEITEERSEAQLEK